MKANTEYNNSGAYLFRKRVSSRSPREAELGRAEAITSSAQAAALLFHASQNNTRGGFTGAATWERIAGQNRVRGIGPIKFGVRRSAAKASVIAALPSPPVARGEISEARDSDCYKDQIKHEAFFLRLADGVTPHSVSWAQVRGLRLTGLGLIA